MFLEPLVRRNRTFVETTVALHQEGLLPANSYVLDLENARTIVAEAARHNLAVFAMTKQIGRNPPAIGAAAAGGIDRFVAVDMACARTLHAHGYQVGHVGHLGQIARAEAAAAAGQANRVQPRWRASRRRAIPFTRVTRAASMPPTSRPSPSHWTGSTAHVSPASRASRRCCWMPRRTTCTSPPTWRHCGKARRHWRRPASATLPSMRPARPHRSCLASLQRPVPPRSSRATV